MCVHYWVINSANQGICKKCGKTKDFSPPRVRLNKAEKTETKIPFNPDFYLKGGLCLERLNVR